ncbi:MAG: tetratricopeptide repeat protein [Zoogloea sp.]|nr:tetratricopeptide repeat protein [Zoogloea sp.]
MSAQGRHEEADVLLDEAFLALQDGVWSDHPALVLAESVRARVALAEGNVARAEPLYRRALAMREKNLPAAHPAVARARYELAELYRLQGRYLEATPRFKKSLASLEQVFGPEHPELLPPLTGLAAISLANGEQGGTRRVQHAPAGHPDRLPRAGSSNRSGLAWKPRPTRISPASVTATPRPCTRAW